MEKAGAKSQRENSLQMCSVTMTTLASLRMSAKFTKKILELVVCLVPDLRVIKNSSPSAATTG